MFRKLFPWAMVALMVVLVMAGCSKKPISPEDEVVTNYAPSSITTYPDTVKVTVKWARNSEAEAQSGFGGYYVYCTSRSLTYYGSATDSIVGLNQLPPESLQYFQVPGCPFKNIDSVVVTHDPLTELKLARGTKYYFYARTMVDNELSWSSDWSWSSPLAQGDAHIFAFVPSLNPLSKDSGLYAGLALRRVTNFIDDSLYKTPITVWRDTLIDSLDFSVDTTVTPYDTTYNVVTTIIPVDHDTVFCGHMASDTVYQRRKRVWEDGKPVVVLLKYKLIPTTVTLAAIDLVAKKISATQVELQSPQTNTAIPLDNVWGIKGKASLIQLLPGGWDMSTPEEFGTSPKSVTLTVGEAGNTYQLYLSGCYVKIRVDEVAVIDNSIRVTFHYSYQMVPGIRSF